MAAPTWAPGASCIILALGSFWDSASGGAGFALQMAGHHVRLLLLTVGGAVLNVALSLALAPAWGGYGIAVATTVTLIALNVAMVRSARTLVGVRTFVYTRPVRVAAGPAAGAATATGGERG